MKENSFPPNILNEAVTERISSSIQSKKMSGASATVNLPVPSAEADG